MAKRMVRTQIAPFDASEYLDNQEAVAEYLSAALEDPNPNVFLRAIADSVKSRGIVPIAKAAGLGRESLHQTFAPGAKIPYETVRRLVASLGMRLTVAAA